MPFTKSKEPELYSSIVNCLKEFERGFEEINDERKTALHKLALFVAGKSKAGDTAELIFICTHNSRRSHMAQIWARVAAAYYGIECVIAYSGGTEATAFNPRAVMAMESIGFRIADMTGGTNPVYEIRFSDDVPGLAVFSKKYDSDANPSAGFAAVMTCSHADQHCPTIAGAAVRISTPYEDPKDFDGTPQESEQYLARAQEIGREMLYAFSLVKLI